MEVAARLVDDAKSVPFGASLGGWVETEIDGGVCKRWVECCGAGLSSTGWFAPRASDFEVATSCEIT